MWTTETWTLTQADRDILEVVVVIVIVDGGLVPFVCKTRLKGTTLSITKT